jgi:AraC-like DNA-binding protein
MLVLAAVPEDLYQKLRRAMPERFGFAHARSWEAALAAIRTRPIEMAVVDPQLSGEPRGQEIERLSLLFPSLPLMLYTSFVPQVGPILLQLGQRGIRNVVFARVEDHPQRLRQVLTEVQARAVSQLLLNHIADSLSDLPTEFRWVLEEALRAPEEIQTVGRLAERAHVDRRTCERWFARVGLPSPRHFLAAARVLYAHRLLQDPGFTVEDVAERLGYSQVKTLQQHARTYLGLTAGEMRLSLTPEEALKRVNGQFGLSARTTAAIAS